MKSRFLQLMGQRENFDRADNEIEEENGAQVIRERENKSVKE